MKKEFLQFKVAEATKEKITIIASDETLDRYGEVVPLDQWDLKNYKKNPVLLVDHNYSMSAIVGRAKNLKVGDKQFTFEPEFHNITQLAKEVQQLVETGFAPAVSVGFIPHGPAKDGGKPSNELLEISFVAVPANPSALVLQNALKAVKAEEETEIKSWVEVHNKSAEEETAETGYQNTEAENTETKTNEELTATVASMTTQIAELKEGRVLSGKNRTKIADGVTALKQAAAVLEDLLEATDPNAEKTAETSKGRQTEEEAEPIVPKKAKSTVLRVLQNINRSSNELLAQLKD